MNDQCKNFVQTHSGMGECALAYRVTKAVEIGSDGVAHHTTTTHAVIVGCDGDEKKCEAMYMTNPCSECVHDIANDEDGDEERVHDELECDEFAQTLQPCKYCGQTYPIVEYLAPFYCIRCRTQGCIQARRGFRNFSDLRRFWNGVRKREMQIPRCPAFIIASSDESTYCTNNRHGGLRGAPTMFTCTSCECGGDIFKCEV